MQVRGMQGFKERREKLGHGRKLHAEGKNMLLHLGGRSMGKAHLHSWIFLGLRRRAPICPILSHEIPLMEL